MNTKAKKILVAEARKFKAKMFPDIPAHRACLYLSYSIIHVLREHRIAALMLAGTAYWPRLTEATDDGVSPNVFGYQWTEGTPAKDVIGKAMPEIHVWAGIPATAEIIDLTTGYWPRVCWENLGADWRAPKPPPFWWGSVRDLPKLARYKAYKDAGEVAFQMLKDSVGQ